MRDFQRVVIPGTLARFDPEPDAEVSSVSPASPTPDMSPNAAASPAAAAQPDPAELKTHDVEVSCDLAMDLPLLWADGHQLHQVVVNLIANAHQAMRASEGRRRLAFATRSIEERHAVALTIPDTGPGIPAEICARIFEPFFTTKPSGQGTGLGLSLCRGIAEEHGGGPDRRECAPGHGASFTLMLPVIEPPVREDHSSEGLPEASEPSRILVVDDEPEIATVLSEILSRDGHRVAMAHHGTEGLERLERESYDLVLCDTKMPVLDGQAFFREAAERFPALQGRFVFVTGDILESREAAVHRAHRRALRAETLPPRRSLLRRSPHAGGAVMTPPRGAESRRAP